MYCITAYINVNSFFIGQNEGFVSSVEDIPYEMKMLMEPTGNSEKPRPPVGFELTILRGYLGSFNV